MALEAGDMNQYVSLQSPARSQTAYGDATVIYSSYANVWAEVKPLAGAELLEAAQINPTINHRVRMRYRSDIKADHRIILKSRTLEVISLANVDEADVELRLLCAEAVT